MGYILFIIYLFFFSWLLTRIRFIKNGGVSPKIIIALFLIKIAAGVCNGRLSQNANDSDSWSYHRQSVTEYRLLFNHPGEYFTNIFYSGYKDGHDGLLRFKNSYWNDLKDNLIIKLFSVFDIFSGGYYYVNVILFNFLVFFGNFALFRVFKEMYKGIDGAIIVATFLLPSVVLFASTLHKDGLILAFIGIILFNVYWALHFTGFTFKRVLFIVSSLFLILFLRSYIILAILPALVAWIISAYKKYSPALVFTIVYILAAVVFFNVQIILPSINLAEGLVQKQADFLTLEHGNTFVGVPILSPGISSFLMSAPKALNHVLLRPYFTDISMSKLLLPFCAELFVYELLLVLWLIFRKKGTSFNNPFIYFCIFFSVSALLLIGYIVPVIGAFVRYRSIFLPLLITPLIGSINWKKIHQTIQITK